MRRSPKNDKGNDMTSIFHSLLHSYGVIAPQGFSRGYSIGSYKIVIITMTLVVGVLVVYVPAYERYHLRQDQRREVKETVEKSRELEATLQRLTKEMRSLTDDAAFVSVPGSDQPITAERFLHLLGVEAMRSGIEISDVSHRAPQVPQQRVLYEVVGRGSYAKLAIFSDALLHSGYAILLHDISLNAEGITNEVFTLKARIVFEILS